MLSCTTTPSVNWERKDPLPAGSGGFLAVQWKQTTITSPRPWKGEAVSKNRRNARILRQLAESLLRRVSQGEIPDAVLDELATSLVRQWITYDGNATLFLLGQQIYLILSKTPQGEPCIVPEPALPGWKRQLIRDWKIGPEELAAAFEQLNRGQSAEV